jgi:formate-dependent nitrite reductase membrane component NrfD
MSAAIVVVIAFYLWTGTYAGDTARESVKELTLGRLAPVMWLGAVIIGLVMPLVLSLMNFLGGNLPGQLTAVGILACSVIGGLSFTYSALKAGVYRPIIPNR